MDDLGMKIILTLNQVQFGVFMKTIHMVARVRRGDIFAILSPLAGKEFDRELGRWVCQRIKETVYPDLKPFELYCITNERIGKYGKDAISILKKLPETREAEYCDIEMDVHEAYTAIEALDAYSRIKMGQIWAVRDLFYDIHNKDLDRLDRLLKELAQVAFPEFAGEKHGCWYGIGNKPVGDGQEAFDIQQVIRYVLAWKLHPQGGYTVDFQKPMRWGSEPLATIRIEDGES